MNLAENFTIELSQYVVRRQMMCPVGSMWSVFIEWIRQYVVEGEQQVR